MGAIQIAISNTENSTFQPIFERRGDHDNIWKPLKITLHATTSLIQVSMFLKKFQVVLQTETTSVTENCLCLCLVD